MRFSAAATTDKVLPGFLALRARPFAARLDEILAGRGERGLAGRTSLAAFSIRIASAAIAFLSQVLLARWMGSFDFGIFVLVWTTVTIAGSLSCLGFSMSVVRYIPEYLEKRELHHLGGIMGGSRLFVLLVSSLFTLVGLVGLWAASDTVEPYYLVPFALGLICLPMLALSDALEGIARANSWAMLSLAPIYLLRPLLILLFVGVAALAGYSPDAGVALVAAILATYATTLLQVATITPRTRIQTAGVRPVYRWREWIAVSLPIFLVEGFFFLLTNADVLMVGWFMEPSDVAVYFATVKALVIVHFVYFAVKAGVAPKFAHYANGGDRSSLDAFARVSAGWTFWPSLAMAAIVLALGQPILLLFGEGFDSGYPLLFPLLAGVLARAAVGPAESLLSMTGNQNVCAVILGVTLAVNVTLNFVLIPTHGLAGAAMATAISMGFEALLLALTVHRKLGITMFVLAPKPKEA